MLAKLAKNKVELVNEKTTCLLTSFHGFSLDCKYMEKIRNYLLGHFIKHKPVLFEWYHSTKMLAI